MRFRGGYDGLSVQRFLLYLASALAYIQNALWWLPSWLGLLEPESSAPQEFPDNFSGDIIRERLPLQTFGNFAGRFGGFEEDIMCAVCLTSFEEDDEIRELCNCCHIFHRNCLDKWIDHHQDTCPLCRCALIPQTEMAAVGGGNDEEWVVDRISYLFGEDLMVSS